jgi:hypothetical protein
MIVSHFSLCSFQPLPDPVGVRWSLKLPLRKNGAGLRRPHQFAYRNSDSVIDGVELAIDNA